MITGSTARSAFDAASAALAAARGCRAARVPFDYELSTDRPPWAPWKPPRPSLLIGRESRIVDAWTALRAGRTSARALVEEALDAAARTVPLGGLVEVNPDAVRAATELDAEMAAGHDRGPLHGIPVTVKDVINVGGIATRAGSDAYHRIPDADALAVARWRACGAVVIGKAATHEFALGVTSPQSRNPHDVGRIAGGSSGGSVVCVAAGAGLASLGTDTRASIRVPAALSGAVGFKPTYGSIPTDGVVTLAWTMDHVAPLASTATDAALALDALLGGSSALAWVDGGAKALRVGVPVVTLEAAEPSVAAVVDEGLGRLRGAGAHVELVEEPTAVDFELANAAGLVISRCEAATVHRELDLDRSEYWDEVRDQLAEGARVPATDYLDAQRVRGALHDRMLACFDGLDVLAMPTVPVVAPRVEDFAEYLMVLARNAIPWSLVGFPAISVPSGSVDGLPVGMQFVAPPGGEALLVRIARSLESCLR